MKSMHWLVVGTFLVAMSTLCTQASYAQRSKGKSTTATSKGGRDDNGSRDSEESGSRLSRGSEAVSSKTANVFIHPLQLAVSSFNIITLSVDYKVAKFVTVGLDYVSQSGPTSLGPDYTASNSGGSIRADVYLNGRALTSSFVAQLNYYLLNINTIYRGESVGTETSNGPGVMFGWRWFWSDPGESGLNVGLLLGASNLSNESEPTPKLRVEFGYAF